MIRVGTIFLLLLSPVIAFSQESFDNFPVLSGKYLGQKSPGLTPEKFAPGIINTKRSTGCAAFNRDGTMFIFKRFYSRTENYIFITELQNGKWTKPVVAPFESEYYDGDFTLSPDGKRIYISSRRPPSGMGEQVMSNIWMAEIQSSGWSEPKMFDHPINTEEHESYPSVSANGTLYYFNRDRGGFGESDIFLSRLENGKYAKLENLGAKINTEDHEWDPYIAPDESYLIFCSQKPGGYGKDDFYVSYKMQDGKWSEAVNMGDKINSSGSDNRPFVTLDGKYFFYTSDKDRQRDLYWVDARIIENLRPKISK